MKRIVLLIVSMVLSIAGAMLAIITNHTGRTQVEFKIRSNEYGWKVGENNQNLPTFAIPDSGTDVFCREGFPIFDMIAIDDSGDTYTFYNLGGRAISFLETHVVITDENRDEKPEH